MAIDCNSVRDKTLTIYRHLTLAKYFFFEGKPYRAREHLSQIASNLAAIRRDADCEQSIIATVRDLQQDVSKLINLTQAYAFFKHYAPQELDNLSQGLWTPVKTEEEGTYGGSSTYTRYRPEYVYDAKEAIRLKDSGAKKPIDTDPFNDLEFGVKTLLNKVYKACPIES